MWGLGTEDFVVAPSAQVVGAGEDASLHDILQQEKLQFEEKLERAARRKKWLAGEIAFRPTFDCR